MRRCVVVAVLVVLVFVAVPAAVPELEEIARTSFRWTGVAVSAQGRIFVNFPRWGEIPCSVAELAGGKIVPYPDAGWNLWQEGQPAGERFTCVQSVHVDDANRLWVLDSGASLRTGVIPGAPKLLQVDLESNRVARVFRFPPEVVHGASYLNDVRIDTRRGYAYMTESGQGSLIVLNLETGEARRRLDGHPSTRAEEIELNINGREVKFPVHADGIAMTRDGGTVYYKALAGRALYRIPAAVLRDFALSDEQVAGRVEFAASTLPCDGMEFDRAGNLCLTAIEKNAVYRLSLDGRLEPLVTDARLAWPDSLALGPGGRLFVTTSGILHPEGTRYLFVLGLPPAAGKTCEKKNGGQPAKR